MKTNFAETDRHALDADLRCCGRKTMEYKRPPYRFCPRCDRAYDAESLIQIENWAWKVVEGRFVSTRKPFGSVAVKSVPTLDL